MLSWSWERSIVVLIKPSLSMSTCSYRLFGGCSKIYPNIEAIQYVHVGKSLVMLLTFRTSLSSLAIFWSEVFTRYMDALLWWFMEALYVSGGIRAQTIFLMFLDSAWTPKARISSNVCVQFVQTSGWRGWIDGFRQFQVVHRRNLHFWRTCPFFCGVSFARLKISN